MIKKIAFVSLRSKDIDADKRFYGELLGLKLTSDHSFELEDGTARQWVEFDTPEGKSIAIETCSPPATPTTLALETDDIEAEVARLKAAGVAFEGDIQDNKVCKMAWAIAPSGQAIMLHQIAPDRA
ncbi:MAG: VOC family protein [Planctomycetes bacterium]|nr:VOC family protein [Planctomycetota bacterium]